MFQNNEKYSNIRLNENAIMTIRKYKNNLGNGYHHLTLKYLDTNEEFDFGSFLIKPKHLFSDIKDDYEYNNEYIITYSYDSNAQGLLVNEVFDITNRKSLLSRTEEETFGDYYTSIEVSDEIHINKYKKVKVKKK